MKTPTELLDQVTLNIGRMQFCVECPDFFTNGERIKAAREHLHAAYIAMSRLDSLKNGACLSLDAIIDGCVERGMKVPQREIVDLQAERERLLGL